MNMDKSPIPIGHFADIGQGQQIHYHAAGPADGEVVIFLHGAGGGASGYSNFKGNLPGVRRGRLSQPSCPTCSASACRASPKRPPMYDLDFFVDPASSGWSITLGLKNVTLLGNSLGGADRARLTRCSIRPMSSG
jgi:4,5:9,10-diseco-3-hydroxy-5,9,17-trioxoandrosta-1(10),2-diene-4-oate hydrolase